MKQPARHLLALVLLLEATAYAVPRFADTWTVRRGDFEAYFRAGQRLREGHAAELYSDPVKAFKNIPLVAAIFVPLSRLDYGTAWHVWWVLSALSSVAAGAVFCLGVPRRDRALAAVGVTWAAAHYYPLLDGFALGQTSLAAALGLLLGWMAQRAGRDVLAGIALAICAVLKIPLSFLGVVLCLTGRWRAAAAFTAALAAMAMASVAGWGLELHRVWFREVIAANAGQVFLALNNQSLVAELTRLSGRVGHYTYDLVRLARGVAALQAALLVAVFGAWAWYRRRVRALAVRRDLDLALGLALTPLVYPVFWVHYFLFLLAAMLYVARGLLAEDARDPAALLALAGAYGLSAWAPARELWTARRASLICELWRGHWLWAAPLLAAGCFAAARAHAARDLPG